MRHVAHRIIFLSIKDFIKARFPRPYALVRDAILMIIVTKRRQLKLRSALKKDPFFNFSYRGISFRMKLDPENGYVDEKICDEGVYEPEMLDAFIKYIHPGMTFVDIGANIGQHTLFVSRLVGDTGNVISFEPIPKLYEQIKVSVEENKMTNINLINAGCGNTEETLTLYTDNLNVAASSLIKPHTSHQLITREVRIIRPEPILLSYQKIDAIKIDVEGYEYQTLLGLEKILYRDRPIIFLEYSPTFYENKEHTGEHDGILLLLLLEKYGYHIQDLDKRYENADKNLALWGREFDRLTKHLPHRQINLICTTTQP